jgi:hypothetical protein
MVFLIYSKQIPGKYLYYATDASFQILSNSLIATHSAALVDLGRFFSFLIYT